jgi:shikimate kinase
MTGPRTVLVGPPGAGKTTVGTLLADRLDLPFRDADQDIEITAGRTIGDIFTTDGESAFRSLEERAVEAALAEHPGVLSVGGGAVLSERTRRLLREHRVVFLNVGVSEGLRRTGMSTARPLLAGVNPRATFRALLTARLPLYREVATVEVLTDNLKSDEVTDAVLRALAGQPEVAGT